MDLRVKSEGDSENGINALTGDFVHDHRAPVAAKAARTKAFLTDR
jgi:hypothetical protein